MTMTKNLVDINVGDGGEDQDRAAFLVNCIRSYFPFVLCVVCVRYLLVRYRHTINHCFKAVSHIKRGKNNEEHDEAFRS